MNVFENQNSSDQSWVNSEFEAWAGILYSCIAADHQITDSEKTTLARLLHSKEKFNGIDIAPLYAKAFNVRTQVGQLKYISACCAFIKEEDKETLFALALEVLLADGTLEKEEKNLIEVLSKQLKIESAMTSKIVEVIFLKNKGNIKGI